MSNQNLRPTFMQTALRFTLWMCAVVILLFATAIVIVHFVDWREYTDTIAKTMTKKTGRNLQIGGPVKVGIFPIRVLIGDVTFDNAIGGSRDVMVKVKRVGVRFKLADLIRGQLSLSIDLHEPDILLETVESGKKNWSLNFEVPEKLAFARLKVTDGQVVYREHPSGKAWRLVIAQLLLREKWGIGYSGRLDANLNDIAVTLNGEVKPAAVIADKEDALQIDGQAVISGAKLKLEGLASKGADGSIVKGKVQVKISDLSTFEKLLQTSLPSPPPMSLTANVEASNHQINVEVLDAAAGKSSFTGKITADIGGKRPTIKGTISSKHIDITELIGGGRKRAAKTKDPKSKEQQTNDQTLPITSLDKVDISLTLSVEKILAGNELTIQSLQTKIELAGGRLTLKPLKMKVAGADVNLVTEVQGVSDKYVRLSAKLDAAGVELGELLKTVSGKEELTGGRMEILADVQATGRQPSSLVSTLDGHVRIVVGPGRINNRNLDDLLGDALTKVVDSIDPFHTKENTSELKCLVINVPVRNGVVLIDDTVAMETDKVGVFISGLVHLDTEKIDLIARPTAKEGLGLGADLVADLVRIQGTLSEPRTEVDPVGVAKTTLFRGIDIATFGLTALFRGLTSKITADQMCEEALRPRNSSPN